MTILRRASGVLGLAATIMVLAAPAAAAPAATSGPGADIADGAITLAGSPERPAFRPGEPVRLAFTVTNASQTTCGLATTPVGTMRMVSLRRDGEEVTPLLGNSYYADGIAGAIAASMTATDPGSSVTVRVSSIPDGERELLRSVTPTGYGDGLDTLWPVNGPGRYELTVAYAVAPSEAEVARCTGSAATAVTFTVGDIAPGSTGGPWWVIAVGAALVIVVIVVAMMLARRRRGRRSGAASAAVVIVLLGAVATVIAPGRPAQARLEVDVRNSDPFTPPIDVEAMVTGCIERFRAPGAIPLISCHRYWTR